MFQQYWFLPKILDRKYSLIEKLSVWFLGDAYIDHKGTLRLKDYAVYSSFNVYGYATVNPYMNSKDEQRRFERFGIVLVSKQAKNIFEKRVRLLRAEIIVKRKSKNDIQKSKNS